MDNCPLLSQLPKFFKKLNMPTESEQTFTYETLFEQHIPDCIQLALNNYEEFKDQPAHLEQWFAQRIVHNPWQKALPGIAVGIKHQGRLIAFRAMFAQPWWLNGLSTTVAFAANTTVDHHYRGKGLGTLLIGDSKKFAAITGSTSAGVITQKVYKKLGFFEVGGANNDFFRLRVSFQGSLIKRLGKILGSGLGRLLDLVSTINESLSRQQSFEIQIIEVTLNNDYETGIDWTAIAASGIKGLNNLSLNTAMLTESETFWICQIANPRSVDEASYKALKCNWQVGASKSRQFK